MPPFATINAWSLDFMESTKFLVTSDAIFSQISEIQTLSTFEILNFFKRFLISDQRCSIGFKSVYSGGVWSLWISFSVRYSWISFPSILESLENVIYGWGKKRREPDDICSWVPARASKMIADRLACSMRIRRQIEIWNVNN